MAPASDRETPSAAYADGSLPAGECPCAYGHECVCSTKTPNAIETARKILGTHEIDMDAVFTVCHAYLWAESQRELLAQDPLPVGDALARLEGQLEAEQTEGWVIPAKRTYREYAARQALHALRNFLSTLATYEESLQPDPDTEPMPHV